MFRPTRLATVTLVIALTLVACDSPPSSEPLPQREAGRVIDFSVDAIDRDGKYIDSVVTLVVSAVAKDGVIRHRDTPDGPWLPGPLVKPTFPLGSVYRVGLTNSIVTASATAEMLAEPGDTLICQAKDATGQVIDTNRQTVPGNAVTGGLHPLTVTCTA